MVAARPVAASLSAVIIARNECQRLPACLDSVAFASERLVVDSGSTDGTQALARRRGARVVEQAFLGFGPQKQFAVDQARHDWVLCLDADERVTGELRRSILAALRAPRFNGYRLARCNRFMGKRLRHGEGYPDWHLRLFHRVHAHWSADVVHERVMAAGPVGTLHGDLDHESEQGIASYLAKQNHYTSLQAEELFRRGKRIGVTTLVLSPLLRFAKFYLFRGGFRDGVPGLVHVAIGCMNSFVKYAKLLEMQRRDPTGELRQPGP
jgi:glycosyltransferase involved in cell wall biosynthesis